MENIQSCQYLFFKAKKCNVSISLNVNLFLLQQLNRVNEFLPVFEVYPVISAVPKVSNSNWAVSECLTVIGTFSVDSICKPWQHPGLNSYLIARHSLVP